MDAIQVRKQYPALFFPKASLNLPVGWVWLVAGLCHALDDHMHRTDEGQRIYITAIQEDRGKLLIMTTKGDIILRAMIKAIELASKHVCQLCGESKQVGQTNGWPILTICRNCCSNEPKYRLHVLLPHNFLPNETQTIELATRAMRNYWFKSALLKLL
jgi:hypothetical protein